MESKLTGDYLGAANDAKGFFELCKQMVTLTGK